MKIRFALAALLAACMGSVAGAAGGCDKNAIGSFERYAKVVDSLRPDKAGQALLYASSGAQFTPAEASWLKAQIRAAERACDLGDGPEAARRLEDVRSLVESRR